MPGKHATSYNGDDVRAFADRYVGIQSAAALLGVQYQTVQRGVRRGQYTKACVYGTPKYTDYLFDRRALEDVQANQITSDEAAKLLGMGCMQFRQLIRSEQIAPVVTTMVRDRTFERQDIVRLRTKRRRRAPSLTAPFVEVAEAASYIGVTAETFNRWVARKMIRETSVGNVRRDTFAVEDIVRLCSSQPTKEEMRRLNGDPVDTLTAVQLLKVNPDTFTRWVSSRWIEPIDSSGEITRRYAREDVMALASDVCVTSEDG